MLPSIFNDNLFDDFFNFPFYDDKAERRAEKKLYGHHAHNLMKTDIKEKKDGYELEMDLPGFKKDEITAELKDGYMTISAAKGLDENEKDKKSGNRRKIPDVIFVVSVTPVPARELSMLEKMLQKRISRLSSNTVS